MNFRQILKLVKSAEKVQTWLDISWSECVQFVGEIARAPVAQWIRASDFGSEGSGVSSPPGRAICRSRHSYSCNSSLFVL